MTTEALAPLAAWTPAPPHTAAFDSTFAFRRDPYRFIARTAAALGSDVFETRLLLQPVICMTGAEAARLFYDPARFRRAGAAPEALQATLFGKGGVQGLDGAAHRCRKAMFIEQTGPARTADLAARVREGWRAALPLWRREPSVRLAQALQPVLARAAFDWAGLPLPQAELPLRTRQLVALFDGAAGSLWSHLVARWSRWRLESWLAMRLHEARERRLRLAPGSPAEAVIWHREPDGRLLAPRIAAVELLNLLRPVVAVSVWIGFVAHALHSQPGQRRVLQAEGLQGRRALDFVREVRRHYPFFPAVAARVVEDFEWQGHRFAAGRRALLDLYGTNHDARCWHEPWVFDPQRFQDRPPGLYDFIPQGGADAVHHHRCPGEDIATQLMLLALQMLLQEMPYELPPQDLRLDFARLPAQPRDGLRISVR